MTTENNPTNQQNEYRPEYTENRKPPSFGRVFWGVVFIAAAAVIILNKFAFLQVPGIGAVSFIIIVVMLIILIACLPRLLWFGVFFPLAVIFEIVVNRLGTNMEDFGIWAVCLVALLLSIGFSILFRRRKAPKYWHGKNAHGNASYRNCQSGEGDERYKHVFDDQDGSEVFASTKFGYAVKYINTDHLERGLLEVSAGTMKVYFDNAKIPSGTATIEIRVNAGSMELYIPRAWAVVHQYENRMSGIEERGVPEPAENAPRLVLTGGISVANLAIIHV